MPIANSSCLVAFSSKWDFSSYLWHFKSCNFPALSNKCSKFSFISCHATQAGSSYFITFVWFDAITAILFSRFQISIYSIYSHFSSTLHKVCRLVLRKLSRRSEVTFYFPKSHQSSGSFGTLVHFKCFPNVFNLISKHFLISTVFNSNQNIILKIWIEENGNSRL